MSIDQAQSQIQEGWNRKPRTCSVCSRIWLPRVVSERFCGDLCRLLSKARVPADHNECWEWTGRKTKTGYAAFRFRGTETIGHRVAFGLFNSNPPRGMSVMHSCDNRGCVNPGHLSLGTQRENILDMEAKGRARHPRGSATGNSKLTERDVFFIRTSPLHNAAIARKLGVSKGTVGQIKKRRVWKWFDESSYQVEVAK